MYDELVKRLRNAAQWADKGLVITPSVCLEAAKAIEELQAKHTPMKVIEIHVDEYYCPNCGAENNCDQGRVQDNYCSVCGQRIFAEPPKEET